MAPAKDDYRYDEFYRQVEPIDTSEPKDEFGDVTQVDSDDFDIPLLKDYPAGGIERSPSPVASDVTQVYQPLRHNVLGTIP